MVDKYFDRIWRHCLYSTLFDELVQDLKQHHYNVYVVAWDWWYTNSALAEVVAYYVSADTGRDRYPWVVCTKIEQICSLLNLLCKFQDLFIGALVQDDTESHTALYQKDYVIYRFNTAYMNTMSRLVRDIIAQLHDDGVLWDGISQPRNITSLVDVINSAPHYQFDPWESSLAYALLTHAGYYLRTTDL